MQARARRTALTLTLTLGLTAGALAQEPEPPRDDATLEVKYPADQDLEVQGLLRAWSRRFGGALVVPTPNAGSTRVRLVTPVDGPISWGAVKAILALHDIAVVESQPTPGGPWLIRAWDRRRDPQAREQLVAGRVVDPAALPDRDELVTAVIPIQHGAGGHIFAHVRALLGAREMVPSMLHIPGAEVIVLVDTASRVRQVARLIAALDIAGPRRELEVIEIRHAPVERLAGTLTSVLAAAATQGAVLPGSAPPPPPTVHADPRTNQLIVSALPVDLPQVRRLVERLDRRVDPPAGRLHVYKCRESEAKDLAARVSELLSAGGGQGPGGPQGAPAGVDQVETRVVADEGTNSLLVKAEEPAWQEILALLAQLDQRRRRVHIECEIWEVFTPIDQLSLGVELLSLDRPHEGSLRPAAGTSFDLSSFTPEGGRVPNPGQGLTAVLTKDAFDRLPLIVRAVHSFEQAKLLTRPFTLTNDGEKSSFKVADELPYATTDLVQGGGSAGRVVYVDATTRLEIEPQINSDESLTLELTLDLSSFSGSGSPTLPPGKNTRTYTGKVTVQSGRYAVFGGLESETERVAESKVPLLGDIPILGHVFKNWTRSRTRTRLYVFVRPIVFSDGLDGAERRAAEALRERIQVQAGRDEWLPPVVPERVLRGEELQDEAFLVFGTGSGDPVRGGR